MSANGDGNDGDDGDGGPGTREVAYRLFAAEFDDCDLQFSESDEERAPNFVITPTGGRVNRMFLVGVLTELEQVNQSMLRARIVDPTGAFVVYAGQYQPEALSFLERTEPPAFLAVTGKARTYQPEDSDVVYSSVRPESISEVDAATRDRWVVSTAEQTLDRIGVMAAAIDSGLSGDALREHLESEGVDAALAQGTSLAREHYGTTPAYLDALRDLSLDAARVVANELDEAGSLELAPDKGGEADLDGLRSSDVGTVTAGAPGDAGGTPSAGRSGATDGSTTETIEPAMEGTEAPETGTTGATTAEAEETATQANADAATGESTTAETTSAEASTPTSTAEADATGADEDIGEFEPGEFDAEEPEEDPLGDDVREQVEEEYGTEFSTGTEVESEPDLEPESEPEEPGPESAEEPESADEAAAESESGPEAETDAEPATGSEEAPTDEPEAESVEESDGEPTGESGEDVDLSEAVMDAMRDLDDGDGAPTDEVIAQVTDRTGASAEEVDEAVQDALMGGQCYEPEDGLLKPI